MYFFNNSTNQGIKQLCPVKKMKKNRLCCLRSEIDKVFQNCLRKFRKINLNIKNWSYVNNMADDRCTKRILFMLNFFYSIMLKFLG